MPSTSPTPNALGTADPQPAAGRVLWHFTMSLDGFVADPDHGLDWLAGASLRPGLFEEYVASTGAVLGGRADLDAHSDVRNLYGGDWHGPVFVLTHHPDDLLPVPGVTVLSCDVAQAARVALSAAGGKDLEVLSASIGCQLLERGLINEVHLQIAPVPLGEEVRLFTPRGGPDPAGAARRRRPHPDRGRAVPAVPTAASPER